MAGCKMQVSFETNVKKEKFPVMIYSHGLGGMRTTYSAYCSHMASHGFIVAAIESRDGSAALSMRDNYTKKINYSRPTQFDDEFVFKFRRDQLERVRVREVVDTIDLLRDLNMNVLVKNELESLFDWSQFANTMDFDLFVMAGHSFGAANAISVLQKKDHPFTLGILQDPWMLPTVSGNINVPVFSLQSEKFHWKVNLRSMYDQFKENLTPSSIFGVIKGTVHQSFSDFALLWPFLTKFVGFSGKVDATESMRLMVESSMEFIVKHSPVEGYKADSEYFERQHELVVFQKEAFKMLADQLDTSLD